MSVAALPDRYHYTMDRTDAYTNKLHGCSWGVARLTETPGLSGIPKELVRGENVQWFPPAN